MIRKNRGGIIGSIDNVPLKRHCGSDRRNWFNVIIYEPVRREIYHWPEKIKKDLGSILTKIQKGELLGEPETKSMKSVSPGCFEIRLRSSDGIYRVFYILKTDVGILIFHSFKKKTQKTAKEEIKTAKIRLQIMLEEFKNEKY